MLNRSHRTIDIMKITPKDVAIVYGERLETSKPMRANLASAIAGIAGTFGRESRTAAKPLEAAVAALADRFQRLPPRTVGIAKRIINSGHNLSMRDSQNLEIDALAELLDSPDVREAIESTLEKRRPRFGGE